MLKHRRGQSTAEYAIVFAVVLAALVGMQIYVKRGAQARLKLGVDEFTKAGSEALPWLEGSGSALEGDVTLKRSGSQYEPYYAESSYTTTRQSTTNEDIDLPGGTITRTIPTDDAGKEKTTRKAGGYQKQRGPGEAK